MSVIAIRGGWAFNLVSEVESLRVEAGVLRGEVIRQRRRAEIAEAELADAYQSMLKTNQEEQ